MDNAWRITSAEQNTASMDTYLLRLIFSYVSMDAVFCSADIILHALSIAYFLIRTAKHSYTCVYMFGNNEIT